MPHIISWLCYHPWYKHSIFGVSLFLEYKAALRVAQSSSREENAICFRCIKAISPGSPHSTENLCLCIWVSEEGLEYLAPWHLQSIYLYRLARTACNYIEQADLVETILSSCKWLCFCTPPSWGWNADGQLGLGDLITRFTPELVDICNDSAIRVSKVLFHT